MVNLHISANKYLYKPISDAKVLPTTTTKQEESPMDQPKISTLYVLADISASRMHQAIDAANCNIKFDKKRGFVILPRSGDPLYHNLTDEELLQLADMAFDQLPIVKELAKRFETAINLIEE